VTAVDEHAERSDGRIPFSCLKRERICALGTDSEVFNICCDIWLEKHFNRKKKKEKKHHQTSINLCETEQQRQRTERGQKFTPV